MKLFATVVASAASQGFYDYSLFNNYGAPQASYDGKYGNVVGNTDTGTNKGLRSGNGRYCHATHDHIVIHRWDVSKTGFFNHYNRIECQGEEMYCFLEERAHFGQVIGIRAGCAQMMNHPQVKRTRLTSQRSYNNNREAFRERTFSNQGTNLVLGYGVGGCMAMQVQNNKDQLDNTFDADVEDNMFFYGSWYQAQCLRSVSRQDAGWNNLLPFGVSVCRACCVAGLDSETNYSAEGAGPCNFLPYKQPANGATLNERPHIPFGYDFACQKGYQQGVAVAALDHEYIAGATQAMIMDKPTFVAAAGVIDLVGPSAGTCQTQCDPNRATENLSQVAGLQEAAGGITYHSPSADTGKIRHFSCNDFFYWERGFSQELIVKQNGGGKDDVPYPGFEYYALPDADWYEKGADGICDGTILNQVECYPKTFEQGALLIGGDVGGEPTNAFDFNAHTWVDGSDCDICLNELVPRFDAVNYDSASIVNLFSAACSSQTKRCDPVAKTVTDMQLLFT